MMRQFPEKIDGSWGGAIWRFNTHCKTEAGCGTICEILRVLRRISAIVVWPMVAGIADCRLSLADGHWKELPHHFFNRQSAIGYENLAFGLRPCRVVDPGVFYSKSAEKPRRGVRRRSEALANSSSGACYRAY
jgi:hypothetical protein